MLPSFPPVSSVDSPVSTPELALTFRHPIDYRPLVSVSLYETNLSPSCGLVNLPISLIYKPSGPYLLAFSVSLTTLIDLTRILVSSLVLDRAPLESSLPYPIIVDMNRLVRSKNGLASVRYFDSMLHYDISSLAI